MPTDVPRPFFRRLLRWALWTTASLFLIGVLGFAYVTFVGITVDASLLRGRIATVFSDALGRTVRFDGPMELEISARPKLRVGGLHIANAPGFEGGDFASLGEARLALDLWPLLQKRLQIEEVIGSRVQVRLQRRADGSNNWTFLRPRRSTPRVAEPGTPASVSADRALALLDIQQVTLENLNVEYIAPTGTSHYFDLHKLSAQSPSGQPLKVSLNGAVEKQFPVPARFHRWRAGRSVGSRQTVAGRSDAHFPEFDAYAEGHAVGTQRPDRIRRRHREPARVRTTVPDQAPGGRRQRHRRDHQLRAGQGFAQAARRRHGWHRVDRRPRFRLFGRQTEGQRRAHHPAAGSASFSG